jgi:hypothetical protein
MARLDGITKYVMATAPRCSALSKALAMQIQQILHPQDDVTQLDACHA